MLARWPSRTADNSVPKFAHDRWHGATKQKALHRGQLGANSCRAMKRSHDQPGLGNSGLVNVEFMASSFCFSTVSDDTLLAVFTARWNGCVSYKKMKLGHGGSK